MVYMLILRTYKAVERKPKEMLNWRHSRNGNGKVLGKMKRKQAGKMEKKQENCGQLTATWQDAKNSEKIPVVHVTVGEYGGYGGPW